jgi:hypothetical protein
MLQTGRSPVQVPDAVDFFNLPNPSSRTMALGSTQSLTGMSTWKFPGDKGRRRVGLTTLPPSVNRMSENVGASASHSPECPHGLYRDNFTFYLIYFREIVCESVDWTYLAQVSVQRLFRLDTVMNIRVPQEVENFLTTEEIIRCSRWTPLYEVS